MTGHSSPFSRETQKAGEEARQLLAPLYGQAPRLELGEAAEFEAVRDLVVDWLDEPSGAELPAPSRESFLERACKGPDDAAQVSPLSGPVWMRRKGGERPLAQSSRFLALPGDLLVLPPGSRAEVRMPDGSSILLRDNTRFVIGRREGKSQGKLLRGRLYAWVEEQIRTTFRIMTPLGTATVVGTQFDLDLEDPHRVHLLVTRGTVEFHSHRGEGVPQSHMVSKNRLLSSSRTEITMKKLSPWEVRRRTQWVRGESPRRGRFLFGLAVAVVLALAGGAWWWRELNEAPVQTATSPVLPSAPSAPITQAPTLSKTGPLRLAPTCFEKAMKWRTRVQTQHFHPVQGSQSTWEPGVSFTVSSETLEGSSPAGGTVSVYVDEFFLPGNNPSSRLAVGMIGRRMMWEVTSRGEIRSVSILDGKPIVGQEIDFFGAAIGASGAACLGAAGQVVSPGDTWRTQSQFAIPGYPNSSITISSIARFDGYQVVNGVERAVIQESTQTLLTGRILVEQNRKPPLLIQVYLDSVKASTNATCYVDPQTGRTVAARSFSPGGEVGATIVTTAPGRPPVEQPLNPPTSAQVVADMTVEYLP